MVWIEMWKGSIRLLCMSRWCQYIGVGLLFETDLEKIFIKIFEDPWWIFY